MRYGKHGTGYQFFYSEYPTDYIILNHSTFVSNPLNKFLITFATIRRTHSRRYIHLDIPTTFSRSDQQDLVCSHAIGVRRNFNPVVTLNNSTSGIGRGLE